MVRNILKKPSQIAAVLAAVGLGGGDTSVAKGTGVSAVNGQGTIQQVITFKNTPVVMADHSTVVGYGSVKFWTFEAGQIEITGCVANLVLTKSSTGIGATWNGDFGVGSVAADNTSTLSSTEDNVIATVSTPAAVAGVSSAKGKLTTPVVLDGSVTPVDLYANLLVDTGDETIATTPCNLILNGTITITYTNNGVA